MSAVSRVQEAMYIWPRGQGKARDIFASDRPVSCRLHISSLPLAMWPSSRAVSHAAPRRTTALRYVRISIAPTSHTDVTDMQTPTRARRADGLDIQLSRCILALSSGPSGYAGYPDAAAGRQWTIRGLDAGLPRAWNSERTASTAHASEHAGSECLAWVSGSASGYTGAGLPRGKSIRLLGTWVKRSQDAWACHSVLAAMRPIVLIGIVTAIIVTTHQ